MARAPTALSPDALDFAPGLLAIQESPPAKLPRAVAFTVLALFLIMLAWALFGKLDIVASAEGRLVPQTYVKIVQPADAGIVQACRTYPLKPLFRYSSSCAEESTASSPS